MGHRISVPKWCYVLMSCRSLSSKYTCPSNCMCLRALLGQPSELTRSAPEVSSQQVLKSFNQHFEKTPRIEPYNDVEALLLKPSPPMKVNDGKMVNLGIYRLTVHGRGPTLHVPRVTNARLREIEVLKTNTTTVIVWELKIGREDVARYDRE